MHPIQGVFALNFTFHLRFVKYFDAYFFINFSIRLISQFLFFTSLITYPKCLDFNVALYLSFTHQEILIYKFEEFDLVREELIKYLYIVAL
jgi:hypothetical protein